MLFVDLVDPAELTGAARVVPNPADYTLNRYLPDIERRTTEYEITAATITIGEAKYRGYDAPREMLKRRASLETRRGALPALGGLLGVGEYERLRLLELEGMNNGRLIQQAYNDVRNGVLSIRRRLERARASVLFTGLMVIDELPGGDISIDYGVDPDHLDVAPTHLWSDTANADPLGDLETWWEAYHDGTDKVPNLGGQYPGRMLGSRRIANALRKTDTFIKAVWGPQATQGNVTFEQMNQVLIANNYPALELYDTKVEGTRLSGDDKLVLLPTTAEDLGHTLWGVTAEALELVGSNEIDFTIEDAPGIIAMQEKSTNPVSVWTDVAACGMPIIEHPELLFTADVL